MAAFQFTGPDGTVFEFDEELSPQLLSDAIAGYYVVQTFDKVMAAKSDADADALKAEFPGEFNGSRA